MREHLSPQDNLWVAILLAEKSFKEMPALQVQRLLAQQGFPQRIINNFLIKRK